MAYQLNLFPANTSLADIAQFASNKLAVSGNLLCAFGIKSDNGQTVNWMAFETGAAAGNEVSFVPTGDAAPDGFTKIGAGEFTIDGATVFLTAFYK